METVSIKEEQGRKVDIIDQLHTKLDLLKPDNLHAMAIVFKGMKLLTLMLLMIQVVGVKLAIASEVQLVGGIDEEPMDLYIKGEIDALAVDDVKRLIPLISGMKTVWLNSPGGDVQSAIKIGKILREHQAFARVGKNGKCLSSCVFIYAGAVQRLNGGEVGIHRPYSGTVKKMDMAKWQLWYDQVGKEARSYLKSVNVDPDLYDAMSLISPHKMRLLSDKELFKFGLTARDHVFDEWVKNNAAKKHGLTRKEYEILNEKAKTGCREKHHLSNYKGNLKLANKMLQKCTRSIFEGH